MKHFKHLLLVLIALVTFACSKSEPENTEPTPTPKPTDKIELAAGTDLNPVIPTDGGTLSVTFNASTAWSAQAVNDRADGWCSVSPTSGNAGSGTITITAKANTEPDERSASINIKAGTAAQTIKITQKQKDALTVTASTFEVPAEGKDINIGVKANINITYKIDQQCSDWIKYVSTKALKTSTLTFAVSKNENVEKRDGKIIIGEGALSDTIKIFQAGETPSIVLNKDEYIAKSEGETFAIEVASNVDVNINILHPDGSPTWLQEHKTKTMSTNTYYFTAATNEEYDNREARIVFANKENNLSDTVKVIQLQKDAIVLAKNIYEIDNKGGNISIEVAHNIDYKVAIGADWIKQVETKGLETDCLSFEIAENKEYDNRDAIITFSSANGSITQDVKVCQSQANAVIISKKEYILNSTGGDVTIEVRSNVDFTVENPNCDWIHEVKTKGLTTHTLNYKVDENTGYDSRTASIIITNSKTGEKDSVVISQLQKDAIVLAKNEYEFGVDGGNLDFEIQTNVDVKVEISDNAKSWITQIETRGLETKNLFFNVAKSEEDSLRRGEIKLSGREVEQIISVMQFGVEDMPDTLWYDTNDVNFELVAATNSNSFAFLEKDTLFKYRCLFESKNSNKLVAYCDSVGNVQRFVADDKVYDIFYHSDNTKVDIMYEADGEIKWIKDIDNPASNPQSIHISNTFSYNGNYTQRSYTVHNSNEVLGILQKMSATLYEIIDKTPFETNNKIYAHIYSYLRKYTNYSEEDAQAVALLYAGYDGENYNTHIRKIYEKILNVVSDHAIQIHQALYGNALPVVHSYAGTTENNEVQLICHVNDVDSLHKDFKVGIIVQEDGEPLTYYSNKGKKSEKYNNGKIFYEFLFKGLKSGKRYNFKGFLAPLSLTKDSSIFNSMVNYYRYGSQDHFDKLEVKSEVKEVGYKDATITLSVENPKGIRVETGLLYSLDPTFPTDNTTKIELEASSDKNIVKQVKIGNLEANTTYHYKPYIIYDGNFINKEIGNLTNVFTKDDMVFWGKESSVKTNEVHDNETIRRVLTRIYNECNGVNWEYQKNWCTDAPVSEWEGVYFQPILKSWDLNFIQNELKGTIRIEDCNESVFLGHHNRSNLNLPNEINLIAKNCKEISVPSIYFINVSIENSSFFFVDYFEENPKTKSIRISNCVNKNFWVCCNFANLQSLVLENSTFFSESGIELFNSQIDTFSIINCNFIQGEHTYGHYINIENSHLKKFLIKNVRSDNCRFSIWVDGCVCDKIHSEHNSEQYNEINYKTYNVDMVILNSTINTISSTCKSGHNFFTLGVINSSIFNCCIGNGFRKIGIEENANINYIDTPEAYMWFSDLRKIYSIKSLKIKDFNLDMEDYSLYLSNLQNGIEELEIYDGYARYLDLRNAPPSLKNVKIHYNYTFHHCKVYLDNSINRFNLTLSGKSFNQQIPDSYTGTGPGSFNYVRRYYYFNIYDNDGNVIGRGYNDNNYGWWYSGEPERGYH